MKSDRRSFIQTVLLGIGGLYLAPSTLSAQELCSVQHPFSPPKKDLPGRCHNCGMMRPMWARTFYTYQVNGETKEVCSLHCLAESSINSGIEPQNVKVALYHDPYTMIPAASAFYVIGSKARGTMTMKSKLAFGTKEKAQAFAEQCGGQVVGFEQAFAVAKTSFTKENSKIADNRLKKGKIVEPVDNQDICPVCDMYPARYPKNKCQLKTQDGEIIHFCSTQCLFEYLKNPKKYAKKQVKPVLIWVVDYKTDSWVYGKNAFYVVGSTEQGPMGKEAFPFMSKAAAGEFASAMNGHILQFSEVTIHKIMT